MTDEQIIKAATAAGMTGEATPAVIEFVRNLLEAEIEACAKIVESDPSYDWHKFACEAANAIRARGQA